MPRPAPSILHTWFHKILTPKRKEKLREFLLSPYLSGLLVVMVSWGLYFAYLWPQMLYYNSTGIQAGWIGVWGDWAAHIDYARVFALRPPSMWLSPHPLDINSLFTYPFVADAISGLLMRTGMDLIPAMIYPSIILTIFFLIVIYSFFFRFFKKASTSFVAVCLFLLNGGLGFWWFFKDLSQSANLSEVAAKFAYPPLEYTHLKGQPIEWISIVTSEMIPQRSFLLGFPLVIVIVLILWNWQQAKFKHIKNWQVIALGLLSGLLLFIHAHSFIALFVIASFLLLNDLKQYKHWLTFGISTAIIALPIFYWLHGTTAGSFISWFPTWLAGPTEHNVNIIYFWWLNYGLFLPIAAFATIRYKLYKHPLVQSAWTLFIALNLVKFQPWPWDNTKLLTWAHLFLVIPVMMWLQKRWQSGSIGKVIAVVIFLIFTMSSLLDIWRFTRIDKNTYQMWSYDDLAIAQGFNQIAQPGDRVLTGQNHNSWVVAHTKGQTLLGFTGWLWTYGINEPQLSNDVTTMFAGGPTADQLLRQYHVKFVVIGGPERIDMHANENWFAKNFPLVLQNNEYNVYQTNY